MNEIEITPNIQPGSLSKKTSIRQWFKSFKLQSEDGQSRTSVGASVFNTLLVILGIRVPNQKLFNINDLPVTKIRRLVTTCRIYSVCVFISLCVLPVKWSIDMHQQYSDEKLLHVITEIILPIQYALAIWYYGSNHIQNYYDVIKPIKLKKRMSTLTNIRDIFIDIRVENKNTDFNILIKQPCRITIKVVSCIIIFTILTTFISSLTTSSINQYNYFFPFFVMSRFYGRGTCILNTASFAFIFYKHVKVLNIYSKILERLNWSNQKYDKVSVMLINLTRIRESLKISTNELQKMFSTGTIAGLIIAGILVHSTTVSASYRWGYDSFIVVVSIIILQTIVFCVIAKLSLAKQSIEDVTKSSEFAIKFLSRNSVDQITVENASTLDYWLITDLLSGEWLDFSVMGIPIHSVSFIKQCVSFVSIIIILINTGTLTNIFNTC